MYIYNYSSEPNRKRIFSYVVLFFVALCFSNPFYLLPHFYVRYMHRQFVWFLMSCSMNLLWMCIFPTLRQTSLWFIAVLKFPSYSLFGFLSLKPFEVNDLLQGLNFSKVLNSLVALNKATEGKITVCVWEQYLFHLCKHLDFFGASSCLATTWI